MFGNVPCNDSIAIGLTFFLVPQAKAIQFSGSGAGIASGNFTKA